MKTHATNFTLGAVLTPLALALATLIANEAQTLLGLHLDNVALSLYLLPFLGGAAAVIAALARLEASKVGGELGAALGDLVGTVFGPEDVVATAGPPNSAAPFVEDPTALPPPPSPPAP